VSWQCEENDDAATSSVESRAVPSFTVTEEQLLSTPSRLTEVELDRRVGGRPAGWLEEFGVKGRVRWMQVVQLASPVLLSSRC
jgi:hypothetical protein